MKNRRPRTRQRGQGLVEYALIMVLVAVVVIIALTLLSHALQRSYGIVAAVLGAKRDSAGSHTIQILTSLCVAVPQTHLTGLWVIGTTDEDVTNLTGSTDQAVGTGIGGAASPVESNGPSSFKFHPLLSADVADLSLCPKGVVIQAADGTLALAPVQPVTQ